jgi:hypothetical protein
MWFLIDKKKKKKKKRGWGRGAFYRDVLDFYYKTNPIPLPHLKTVLPRGQTTQADGDLCSGLIQAH